MSNPKPAPYTAAELRSLLRDRMGGQSQKAFADELGISPQFLSQVFRADRSPGCDVILAYLAPKGKVFVEETVWNLVDK